MLDLKTLRLITQDGLRNFAAGRILDGIAALRTLLPYMEGEAIVHAEAEGLEENYRHMLSFLRGGGDDEKRGEVRDKIQRQGVALLEQASRAIRLSINDDLYSRRGQRAKGKEQEDTLPPYKDELERVLGIWTGLLTPEKVGEVQDDLFDLLWTSPLWTSQDTVYWYDFFLRQSDMVRQHFAGAVFLALWEHYDAEKMQLLGLLADDECNRTRITAVAYLLLLRLRHKELAPLLPPLPDSLLSRKGRELVAQVQYEMLLMLVSEKDMENELKEAERLTNSLLSGEKGLNITNLKAIISLRGRYLRNRLQRGLDINLSKIPLLHNCEYMRRASHWFLPFDKTHPLFQSVMIDEKGNEKQNLSTLADLVLDCDVDKLAMLYLVANDKDFSKAVQQLDDQGLPGMEDAVIPEYTFRFLMQDLYRFFGHSPLHTQLANPFRGKETLLDFPDLAALFSREDSVRCCELLVELGREGQALAILDDTIKREGASASALMLKGRILRNSSLNSAITCARSAEILEPENTDILRFLVECYAAQNRFDEELEYLQRLVELLPEDRSLRRLIPVAMNKLGRHEEALQLLFQLDYEMTEGQESRGEGQDENYEAVVSLIADTALALGKLDIAERYTEKECDNLTISQIRLGHIRLLQGDKKGALDHYEQFVNIYCKETGKDIKAALAVLDAGWSNPEVVNLANYPFVKPGDLLLIHDVLQAQADGTLATKP